MLGILDVSLFSELNNPIGFISNRVLKNLISCFLETMICAKNHIKTRFLQKIAFFISNFSVEKYLSFSKSCISNATKLFYDLSFLLEHIDVVLHEYKIYMPDPCLRGLRRHETTEDFFVCFRHLSVR